jgi:hypothetical protein
MTSDNPTPIHAYGENARAVSSRPLYQRKSSPHRLIAQGPTGVGDRSFFGHFLHFFRMSFVRV